MAVRIEDLYASITDFERYPEFLPEVVSARIVKGNKSDRVDVQFELEVIKRFEYVLQFELNSPSRVRWKLITSNFFKTNQGGWQLEATKKGVKARYELEVSFGFLVPKWVTKKLTEVSLPAMLDRFEKRTQEKS